MSERPGLFDALEEQWRMKLRSLGWHEAVGMLQGRWHWRSPDGALLDEQEAFLWLKSYEAANDTDGEVPATS